MIAQVEPVWTALLVAARSDQSPGLVAELLEEVSKRLLATPDEIVLTEQDLRTMCAGAARAIRAADRLPGAVDELLHQAELRRADAVANVPALPDAAPGLLGRNPPTVAPTRRRRRRRGL